MHGLDSWLVLALAYYFSTRILHKHCFDDVEHFVEYMVWMVGLFAYFACQDYTFTTDGDAIIVWKRTEEIYRLTHPQHNQVYMLTTLGPLLLSLSKNQTLIMWDIPSILGAVNREKNKKAGTVVFKHVSPPRGNARTNKEKNPFSLLGGPSEKPSKILLRYVGGCSQQVILGSGSPGTGGWWGKAIKE